MESVAVTDKGVRTKARITRAAADLVWRRGVAGTSLDDVQAATGTSKSQLYHYFADKAALLREVVHVQTERALDAQRPMLDRLDSWEALERWCDELVARKARQGCRGSCPIGSLVTQLAESDPEARADLATAFERWESYLVSGLAAMQERGDLRPEANPKALAVATLASVQGGLLLAQAARSTQPLKLALDAALRHLRSWEASGPARAAGSSEVRSS
jgi:AcrR family transcriptional regulator